MIKTRKDLRFFLQEDAKRNNVSFSIFNYIAHLFVGSDHACIYRYIKCLRHYEYHINNSKNILHRFLGTMYRIKLSRLGLRYNMSIRPNACGYGLRIMHLSGGGGVRIGALKVGNYCGFNAGVLIGTNGGDDTRPIIGDHVAFGPGAKAFGNITIGNHVFVAPNAVVTKDVPDDCIVGGIPAKIIKIREPLQTE